MCLGSIAKILALLVLYTQISCSVGMQIYFFLLFCLTGLAPVALLTISSGELTPLQENATFTCNVSVPSFASFVVNFPDLEFALDTDDFDDYVTSILNERRTFFEKNDRDIVLYILATEENNQTKIHCREILSDNPFSEVVTLSVIGPPLSPGLTSTFVSVNELLLEWEEPFTWPDYNVIHYEIATGSTIINTSNTTYSFIFTAGERLEDCQNFTFMVSAVSDLGKSVPSTLITGSSIAPGEFKEVGDPVIRFAQNGDPEVTITLQPPALCDYQTGVLLLELIDENGEYLPTLMQTYTGQYSFITAVFSRGLKTDTNYTMISKVYSAAGNSSAPSITFYTAGTQQPSPSGSHGTVIGITVPVLLAVTITMV